LLEKYSKDLSNTQHTVRHLIIIADVAQRIKAMIAELAATAAVFTAELLQAHGHFAHTNLCHL